jgi:hypothetical protein
MGFPERSVSMDTLQKLLVVIKQTLKQVRTLRAERDNYILDNLQMASLLQTSQPTVFINL